MGNFLSNLFMAFVKECLRDAEIDHAPTRERREAEKRRHFPKLKRPVRPVHYI